MQSSATSARKPGPPERLSVGAHVFHPAHGVAEVAGIEHRTVGASRATFYVLELAAGGKLLLPTDNTKLSALRMLISASHARRLLKLVATEPDADTTPWRERSAGYADALKEGDADGYTEILRQLLFRSATSTLNMTERRQLDTARAHFVSEVSIVLGRRADQVARQLAGPRDGKRRSR